jgi:acyl carrier protein
MAVSTRSDILSGIAEILIDNGISGAKREDITEGRDWYDLDVDSLSLVEVVVAAEEKFGIRIPDESASGFEKVRDLVNFVEKARQ